MSTAEPAIRVLIVDDHFFVRIGLKDSLAQEKGIEVVAEASNGSGAVEQFREHRPDIVIMDGNLPDIHGSEATRLIISEDPGAKVILLSIDEGEESIHQALEAGVSGYLTKSVSRDELITAIGKIHAGGRHFTEDVSESISRRKTREFLSPREIQVLRLAMKGYANKQIASELGITEYTIKAHMSSVLSKLEVPDRTRAVALAIERGIVKLE